jgi:hypothetical protein
MALPKLSNLERQAMLKTNLAKKKSDRNLSKQVKPAHYQTPRAKKG